MRFFLPWLSVLPLFFPLYLVRFEMAVVPTTLLEVVMGLTVLWGIGLWALRRLPRLPRAWFWLPLGLFFAAATFSMLLVPTATLDINGDPVLSGRIAQGIWKGWIVMPALYFVMIAVISKNEAWWRRTFTALALSGVGLSAWALVQMVTGDYATWDGRASGPFESANYLSLYLAPVLVMAVTRCVGRVLSPVMRAGWGLATLLMAAALWGTESYAAFMAVFAGLSFFLLFHLSFSRARKGKFFLGAFVMGVVLLLTQLDTPKFQQFLDFSGRTSSSVRIEVYTVAMELIQRHPWAGIGLGQFEVQYQINAPDILGHAPYEWVMLHPHNLFLAWWLNTGFLGAVAMMWLVVGIFRKGLHRDHASFLKRWFHRATDRVIGPHVQVRLVGLSMLAVIVVHGLFDTPFFKNDLAYLWWLVLAMGV